MEMPKDRPAKAQFKFQRPARTRYIALTEAGRFAMHTLPKDSRALIEKIMPVFAAARALPPDEERWVWLVRHLPLEVLVELPQLKLTKSKQAGHVAVMLTVYARVLLCPTDESGLRCDMSDDEVHTATNRILLFYFTLEEFQRRGYVEAVLPNDPFAPWETSRITYTATGIAAGQELEIYAAPADAVAGQPVERPYQDWDLQ
jgi:hypothetical protein